MVAFFPWATITERLSVGRFDLVPCAEVLDHSDAAPNRDAVVSILKNYGHRRPVDRANVPLLVSVPGKPLATLNKKQIASAFDFRFRLTFSALAAREFFGLHYCNSDSLRLVIQGFIPEGSGTVLVVTRRRDGRTNNIVSSGAVTVARPHHVDWCELPRDLDVAVLRAIEAAVREEDDKAERLSDAMHVFVGANTDSPDVGLRTELVDSVGAFSRLFDVWKESDTVSAFVKTLPADPEPDHSLRGDRVSTEPLRSILASGKSIREAWLADAYRLRGQYSHGHVDESPYRSAWAPEEHLLLAAYVFPLTVKAALATWGQYRWTEADQIRSDAFDALATLRAFSSRTSGAQSHPWTRMLAKYQMHPWIKKAADLLEAEDAQKTQEPGPPGDSNTESASDEIGRAKRED
jgi:hypothetical protein